MNDTPKPSEPFDPDKSPWPDNVIIPDPRCPAECLTADSYRTLRQQQEHERRRRQVEGTDAG